MTKTLGQIAFDEFSVQTAWNAQLSDWSGQPDDVKVAWNTIAEAVADEACKQASAEWGFQVAKRYEAVIEAAQRFIDEGGQDRFLELENAVCALNSEEE